MKLWMLMVLIIIIVALLISGCEGQPEEEVLVEEEKEGDNLNQPLERLQALGTPLDQRPAQTATATFALG